MKNQNRAVPDNFFIQSGVLPFRIKNGLTEILLITSRKKKKWIFPKGVLENGLSKKDSALKEAFEEAGIVGKIVGGSIGEYSNKKWGGNCNVIIYPMEVSKTIKHWDEDNFRNREWFTISEAEIAISNKSMRKILKKYFKN